MTTKIAIRVVQEIIIENRENGELEGVLNRYRIAALNHLLSLANRETGAVLRRKKTAST
jgi:hypothetical protein